MKKITITSIFAATVITLFSACNNSSSSTWEEPVNDYFDKYTNTAAIEKQEINFPTQKDNSGTTCITSDGDKTVTFYLRNPRQYTLDLTFGDSGIVPVQDMEDKTVAYITYPQSVLLAHEGGGFIGGTITIKEHETQRDFDSYSFSLKCNSAPPSVTGQAVLYSPSNSNHYFVCFYIPTAELNSATHSPDTHSIVIDGPTGQEFGPGTVTELTALSLSRPTDLTQLPDGAAFPATAPSGCTAFYYDTGREKTGSEYLFWNVYLRDSGGFTSQKMAASTIITQATMTVTGDTVLTTESPSNTVTLSASVDDGTVSTWEWTSSAPSIASVPSDNNSSTATVTGLGGGEATINIRATLLDGRIVTASKTVRVVDVNFSESSPQDFIRGQENVALSASKPDFATLSWQSGNESIATVNASGQVTAVAKGSTTISVTASCGSKSVTKTHLIYVHEVTVSGGNELFAGSSNTITLTASVTSPEGRFDPNPSYNWSKSGTAATITNATSPTCTVSPGTSGGNVTVTCKATLNGVQTTVATRTVKVYNLAISASPPTSVNSANSTSSTHALTNTSDSFTLSVQDVISFPTGTTFSWSMAGTTFSKPGSSVTLSPSEMSGFSSKTKDSPWSGTVICTATLPSSLTSSKTTTVSAYLLKIPNFSVSIEPLDSLAETSSGSKIYYVFNSSLSKRFKFTATPNAGEPSFPTGTQFNWSLLSSPTASATLNAAINKFCNGTIPTSQTQYTVTCTASCSGLSSVGPKQVQFSLKPGQTLNPPSKKNELSAFVEDSSGSVISGFTFTSGTDIKKIRIYYDYYPPTGIPSGMSLIYGTYVNGIFMTGGSPSTDHYTNVQEIMDETGIDVNWGTPITISVKAVPYPTSDWPGWEGSDLVDLATITLTKE